jgi:hypothetical protein
MNTCATCKSWSPFGHPIPPELDRQWAGNWDNGACNNEELPYDFLKDPYEELPWTPSDFGCILWEERK